MVAILDLRDGGIIGRFGHASGSSTKETNDNQ